MMKKLEREFLINSLTHLETILSIEDELNFAINHIATGQKHDPRYQANSKITDADKWLQRDKLKFTAAISEAVVRTSKFLYTEVEEEVKELNDAQRILFDEYVPRLTANTDEKDRLSSVRKNGEAIRTELIKELRDEVPYTSTFDNKLTLFSFVTASAVVIGTSIFQAMRQ
jgi:uncharacterized membrane protein